MRKFFDRMESVVFKRAAFEAAAFREWLERVKQQPDLMALLERCLALIRSHLLLNELDLSASWLNMRAGEYGVSERTDLEASFEAWLRERAAAHLVTITGWCGALHHAVLTLSCEGFDAECVTNTDLRILDRVERLAE